MFDMIFSFFPEKHFFTLNFINIAVIRLILLILQRWRQNLFEKD